MRQLSVSEATDAFYSTLYSEESEEQPPRDSFVDDLVLGTTDQLATIDELIRKHSAHWRLERMSAVDRNILRLAIYELRSGQTPVAVVIDQALELGRRFSGDESLPFLNGVLDAARKEIGTGA
jgi:N utilization substance protein B